MNQTEQLSPAIDAPLVIKIMTYMAIHVPKVHFYTLWHGMCADAFEEWRPRNLKKYVLLGSIDGSDMYLSLFIRIIHS